jgi:hypothetical protein
MVGDDKKQKDHLDFKDGPKERHLVRDQAKL